MKIDGNESPFLGNDDSKQESSRDVHVAAMLDLDNGNEDEGGFVFDGAELQSEAAGVMAASQSASQRKTRRTSDITSFGDADAILLNDGLRHEYELPHEETSSHSLIGEGNPHAQSMPRQSHGAHFEGPFKPVLEVTSQDRESGVYFSAENEHPHSSGPISVAPKSARSPPQAPSIALRENASTIAQRTDTTPRRLHRPTELNLGVTDTSSSKPRSELEKRFDLMRNSKTQSKAALRSPTELLKERLNMSPKKSTHGEKIRAFVPPQPLRNGCLLPGPAGQKDAFTSKSVRARTEAGGRPAWWCKFDKLVVFDGIEVQDNEEPKIRTRTSKGLSIARRSGDAETILIPMDCAHCQDMLHRHEWKYEIQVCRRSVCWECRERCKWEQEQEREKVARAESGASRCEGNRDRADSVLQDGEVREDDLIRKMGIEQGRPKSPIEAVGGIAERLESVIDCREHAH
mgnify:CR=1 FL=1|tara:strand:- start:1701 stop:3080 length:1380 start_codon:yes stop_codon:yes gene_type:complete